MSDPEIQLEGYVATGRGNAKKHLEEEADHFSAITQSKLVSGSLNLRLDAPVRLDNAKAAIVEGKGRLLWKARIADEDVWIYRFWEQPLHYFEILAPFHIRDRFGVGDDDTLTLHVPRDIVVPMTRKSYVLWWIMWRFREDWAYTNDVYFNSTRRFCGDLGITQKDGIGSILRSIGRLAKFVIGTAVQKLTGRARSVPRP